MNVALQILAEPRRERILQLVWDREQSAGQIAAQFDVTFGAVSQHLRVLHDASLVIQRKQGRRRLYRANKETLGPFAAALETMWRDRLAMLKMLAESEEKRTRQRKVQTDVASSNIARITRTAGPIRQRSRKGNNR